MPPLFQSLLFPQVFDAPNSYRVAALRERISLQRNWRRLAKQHRNNAVGKVFAATAMPADADARSVTAPSKRNQGKGPGGCPGPLSSCEFKTLFLAPFDLGDLVGLGAAGGDDFHGRALLLSDQRSRQRRGDGDAALLGVGLRLADDLPHRLLFGVLVDQRDSGAELDGVAGQLADVDNIGARKLVLQLGDTAFVVGLLFLRGVILRVLRKVAMRARLGDMLDDARTLHRLALLQFDLKCGITAGGHRNLFHHPSLSFNFVRTNPRHAQTPKQNTLMTGEFQSQGLHCRSITGRKARQLIRFRKNNSAACGPQGPRPDRRGCPARLPRHPKEWCNMALYARGQHVATSGCRPAPAALPWC